MADTRWEHSKAKSSYHFDPTIDEDADPPFKIVGRVEGDLEALCREHVRTYGTRPNGFLNRMQGAPAYTAEQDLAELEYLGLEKEHAFFERIQTENVSQTIQRIIDHFAFKQAWGRFHIQRPGMIFPYHVDELPKVKGNKEDPYLDANPHLAARLEIQVLDWQPGHVWSYGNTYWKQWRAGDIAWHDWRSTPHGTANIGRSERITLQITGLCSPQTIDMIAAGDVHIVL